MTTPFDAGKFAMQNNYSTRLSVLPGRDPFSQLASDGGANAGSCSRCPCQWVSALVIFFIVLASGCGEVTPAKPDPATSTPPKSTTPSTDVEAKATTGPAMPDPAATPAQADAETPADQSIALQEFDWKQLQDLVASHKGKVVVVDLWSTSCEPCLREFPHLVALQKQHPTDVVCISYDCDFIGAKNKPVAYYRERVLKFLETAGAKSVINTMSTIAADELFVQIDVDSIPAVYVYDQSGKLAKRFDNRTPASPTEEGISYESQISPLVSELVKAAQN